jgi:L-alanine-DL-glutamate epimerase-like enolase superfamily enzyme
MPTKIEDYHLTRFAFPRDRVIGDSQVRSETVWLAALELINSNGQVGTGFFGTLFHPLPSLAELKRIIDTEFAASFIGQNAFALTTRITRPRGGNIQTAALGVGEAVDQAAWDLQAQELGMPLYQLLGGTRNKVRAYASGLDYHLSDEQLANLFGQAARLGFRAFKVKVGHPDLAWDLHRLRTVAEAAGAALDPPGERPTLMVDANEAWSPAEAIRRLHAYHEAGLNLLWVEDPCLRFDFDGLRDISRACPFTLVNTGEYLGLRDKRRLIEAGAVDILNIHGNFTDGLRAAWLAHDHGIQVSLGNTVMEMGVHLAAALPGDTWMEYSFLNWNALVETPVRLEGGYAYAPEGPGHGLRLSPQAVARYAQAEIGEVRGEAPGTPLIPRPLLPPRGGRRGVDGG